MLTALQDPLEILIIDDDEVDRMALKRALKATGFTLIVSEVVNADTALETIQNTQLSCIFLDYNLPGKNGLELIKQIRTQGITVPVIVLTGQGDEQTAVETMKAGASDYLPKSKLSADAIARLMRSAIRMHRAEAIVEQVNQDLREKNRLLEQQNKELAQQRRYIHQQNLQLQEVSRLKSEFLATMSHELRTPLNAIIGFSQILLSQAKGPLSQVQNDMLSRVLANGKNLLELINDILSFSKIEAGRLTLEPVQMNIANLVQKTVSELQSLATQKSLTLSVDIQIENAIVINDKSRLRQILVNLLSNAIKFTEVGSVKVNLTCSGETAVETTATNTAPPNTATSQTHPDDEPKDDEPKPAPPSEIILSVKDTGCGISDEDLIYIFDPFHQSDQKVTRKHAGTGLGLAITQSLVTMMGGHIDVKSQLGQGTTFTVKLPSKVVIEKTTPSINRLIYADAHYSKRKHSERKRSSPTQ